MSFWNRILLAWIIITRRWAEWKVCANRFEIKGYSKTWEVVCRFRDTTQPDGYERTELLEMLRTVRQFQRQQNWTDKEIDSAESYAHYL